MNTGYRAFDTLTEHFHNFYGRRVNPNGEKQLAFDWKQCIPGTEKEFQEFYKNCDYADELAYWHIRQDNHPKIKSFRKFYSIIKAIAPSSILDMGAGICTDALQYALDGYITYAIEQNIKSLEFAAYRRSMFFSLLPPFERERFSIALINGNECDEIPKVDLVTLIDVIEHFYDPFKSLTALLRNNPPFFLFTQAFNVHEEEKGGHPQHTDFKIRDIYRHLRGTLGYTKVRVEGVAFPPNLWTTTDRKIVSIRKG